MGYRTIAQAVTASFIEKKSEFIATLVPVQTADAAIACIEEVRKANRKPDTMFMLISCGKTI